MGRLINLALGLAGGASPWLLIGLFVAGLSLGGTLAFIWQLREIDGLTVANAALQESIDGEGGYLARLTAFSKEVEDLRRVNAGQKTTIASLTTAWRSTQVDAEEARIEAENRAAQYRSAESKLREIANAPNADPAGVAGHVVDCLRRLRAARAGGGAGAC
ncbi:MAG: hypothetical protein IPK59_10200 [Rhodospirillaceae bacterium]|nr:hypothetical protein [Rhodospirillaceae bacterium]